MKESEIEEIFQKSLAIAFYEARENEPAAISLIYRKLNEGEKAYTFLRDNLTKDEICLILKPVENEKINLSFIDKKNGQVYNVKDITYQELNFDSFQKKYNEKYTLFLNMFISNGEVIVSSECQFPMLINEVIFENLEL